MPCITYCTLSPTLRPPLHHLQPGAASRWSTAVWTWTRRTATATPRWSASISPVPHQYYSTSRHYFTSISIFQQINSIVLIVSHQHLTNIIFLGLVPPRSTAGHCLHFCSIPPVSHQYLAIISPVSHHHLTSISPVSLGLVPPRSTAGHCSTAFLQQYFRISPVSHQYLTSIISPVTSITIFHQYLTSISRPGAAEVNCWTLLHSFPEFFQQESHQYFTSITKLWDAAAEGGSRLWNGPGPSWAGKLHYL